jgi:hypothetical protein
VIFETSCITYYIYSLEAHDVSADLIDSLRKSAVSVILRGIFYLNGAISAPAGSILADFSANRVKSE